MTSQTIIMYLLKTILIAGIMLAYYWIALRDKKFHYYNRFYLLSASVLSLVVPMLNFNWFSVEEPVLYGSNTVIQFVMTAPQKASYHFGWMEITLTAAGIIAVVLLGLLFINVFKIHKIKKQSEVTPMEGFDFVNTNEENAPFSFLNNLFWKQSISLQDEGGKQIFKHEITHIQQKHTWDRIYCQIVASIFWMNPFNWIIQKELVAIHEFIADEEAIGNSNVEAFAKMLLQAHYGNHFLNPTHSFFYSSIKRRLAMLTKSTNTKYSYLRRVMVLPVLIASICIVSIKVHARETIEKKVTAIQNHISLLVSDTTKPAKKSQKLLPPPPPPPTTSSVASSSDAPPPPSAKPVYYFDGVKINENEMKSISPTDIQSVHIWKGNEAIKRYPNDGMNGVVEIVSKKLERKDQVPNKDWSNINASENVSVNTTKNGEKVNLQNKMDEVTVIGYVKNGNKEVTTAIMNFPKIQKDADPSKNNDPIFYTAEQPAQFPGGSMGWIKYLEKNLNRDLPVANGAPVGKYQVLLNFVVNSDGEVSNVIATNNPGYGTAAEAIRIIEKGPKWIPAVQNGKNVNYLVKQAIVFAVSAE